MQIIGGKYKNRTIHSPKGDQTRPTSARLREALFNICQSYVEGTSFLDLFAGSGAMGLEALSRGASQATFIDNHKECTRAIELSFASFGNAEKADILYGDVFQYMEKLQKRGKQFNIIYADPPYESYQIVNGESQSYSTLIVKLIDEGSLLLPGGQLFIEDAVNSQPLVDNLKTLTLKSSRRLGRSVLLQYEKS